MRPENYLSAGFIKVLKRFINGGEKGLKEIMFKIDKTEYRIKRAEFEAYEDGERITTQAALDLIEVMEEK